MLKRGALSVLVAILWLLPVVASAQNTPPVADAGPDQQLIFGQATSLDGSGSFDPDGGTIVQWSWTVASGPPGAGDPLFAANTSTPFFDADTVGDYLISLVVNDGLDDSPPDFVAITVALNQAPVAIAEASRLCGPAPLVVSFDGAQSFDPEGGALAFHWTFGDGSPSSSEVAAMHEYVIPDAYTAQLTVFDPLNAVD